MVSKMDILLLEYHMVSFSATSLSKSANIENPAYYAGIDIGMNNLVALNFAIFLGTVKMALP